MIEVSPEQSRNQFYAYAYTVLLPPLLPLCCVLLLLLVLFLLRNTVCGFTTEYPDLIHD